MIPAAALETLDGAELIRVLEHVQGCDECTRLLAEYRDVAAAIPLLLPERQLDRGRSAEIRSRLLDRVRAETREQPAEPQRRPGLPGTGASLSPGSRTGWMGWLVAAGLAGVLLMHHSVHQELDYGWLAAGVLALLALGLGVYAGVQRRRLKVLRDQLSSRGSGAVPPDRTESH